MTYISAIFFVGARNYKYNLYDPWDEVIPKLPEIIPF